ncbi:sigma factor-like helix-turn-helix DNA-binding protein [Streptomyces sp. V4I8]|uniref:sigma factor-like helix-turn-helix DNA-binding protein n=1 Tax=Streptomyces sp. V4I8 TaxID=3156469 RepID=UPI0035119883
MPERERQTLCMRFLCGMTQHRIALQLGISQMYWPSGSPSAAPAGRRTARARGPRSRHSPGSGRHNSGEPSRPRHRPPRGHVERRSAAARDRHQLGRRPARVPARGVGEGAGPGKSHPAQGQGRHGAGRSRRGRAGRARQFRMRQHRRRLGRRQGR